MTVFISYPHPMNNRRKFIKIGSILTAGAFIPFQFCSSPNRSEAEDTTQGAENSGNGTLSDFGLQLYSVKEDMAKDVRGTIQKIAGFGYTQIEGFDGGKGIFWGMKNTEFKSFTSDLGLNFISSHANTYENLEMMAEKGAEIGMKYIINPYVGSQKSMDDWKRIADDFNKQGEICKNSGLKFAYHNHGYSFDELEGQIPQDYLIENTDADLVDFEMDTYWVYTAGKDPLNYLDKYPGRFKLGHIKDKSGDLPFDEANGSTVIGTGIMDFQTIMRKGKDNGMDYFIVEQERFDNTNPLDAAQKNAEYMKKVTF